MADSAGDSDSSGFDPSDYDPPVHVLSEPSAFVSHTHAAPAQSQPQPSSPAGEASSSDDDGDGSAPRTGCSDWSQLNVTSRGRYSRDTASKRSTHADQGRVCWQKVQSSALAGACDPQCPLGCQDRFGRNELFLCVEYSYGKIAWISEADLKVSHRKADLTYGALVEHESERGCWTASKKSKATGDAWAGLFDTFVIFDVSGNPMEVFSVAGHQACANFTRQAYGIPLGTWLQGMANAKKQPGGAGITRALTSAGQSFQHVDQIGHVTSTSEAEAWWVDLISEWDFLPNESPPVIKHPSYVGEVLYASVYVAEMELYSAVPPLKQRDGKAPGTWFRAREEAVKLLSLKHFGLKPGATTSEPRLSFRLVERANHSNFAECNVCRANRVEKEENIRERRPRSARDATAAKQVAHMHEVHAERSITTDWVREANRSGTALAELDDKLGSHWNFLPMPPGQRFSKTSASKFQYRQCVMANLFPGYGCFYSLVPPFLVTGNNFGCTAFCISLCQLIRSGKLSSSVTTITRQTDGGSDIDGKTTHAMHYVLVREGACDRLLWGKLRAGHSHNYADCTFAQAKTVFYPRDGVGPGCASPMQYHSALVDKLKTLPGGLEIMWQLANFDFDKFAESFLAREEFTHMQGERLWCYEYAPELEGLYVRCTFKTKLTDQATSLKAEWKPHLPPNAAGWHTTDPAGLVFVKQDGRGKYLQPNFDDPGLDKWVAAEAPAGGEEGAGTDSKCWQREKVFKDIRETAKAENFTAAEKEEWEALFGFHDLYRSPESLPMAPHTLTTATTGRSIELHGMPISWAEMWATLRRVPRPHLASSSTAARPAPTASDAPSTSSAPVEKPLALANSVTGSNHPKRARDKDAETYNMQLEVSQLPRSLSNVALRKLYFVALPDFEGEMSVGVGRPCKQIATGDGAKFEVEWLARRGWSNDPTDAGFAWASSPMFDVCKDGHHVAKNTHPVCDFLPIEVELTGKSNHREDLSLGNALQRFCVTAKCVGRLREFCTRSRPALIKPDQPKRARDK